MRGAFDSNEGLDQPAMQLAQAACPVVLVWLVLCVFGERVVWRMMHRMRAAVLLACGPL